LHARARASTPASADGDVVRVGAFTIKSVAGGRLRAIRLVVRVDGPLRLGEPAARYAASTPCWLCSAVFDSNDRKPICAFNGPAPGSASCGRGPRRGAGTEFEKIEEYNPDPSSCRIDWAATARTGQAVVRTYRAEPAQPCLVLPRQRPLVMAGRVDGVRRVEHAPCAVMMSPRWATRLGDRHRARSCSTVRSAMWCRVGGAPAIRPLWSRAICTGSSLEMTRGLPGRVRLPRCRAQSDRASSWCCRSWPRRK